MRRVARYRMAGARACCQIPAGAMPQLLGAIATRLEGAGQQYTDESRSKSIGFWLATE